jgi:hypothetical protein
MVALNAVAMGTAVHDTDAWCSTLVDFTTSSSETLVGCENVPRTAELKSLVTVMTTTPLTESVALLVVTTVITKEPAGAVTMPRISSTILCCTPLVVASVVNVDDELGGCPAEKRRAGCHCMVPKPTAAPQLSVTPTFPAVTLVVLASWHPNPAVDQPHLSRATHAVQLDPPEQTAQLASSVHATAAPGPADGGPDEALQTVAESNANRSTSDRSTPLKPPCTTRDVPLATAMCDSLPAAVTVPTEAGSANHVHWLHVIL